MRQRARFAGLPSLSAGIADRMKKIFKAIGWITGLLLFVFVVFGLVYACSTGAFVRARHVKMASPQQAVAEARQLILDFQQARTAGQETRWLRVDELPESLKIPRLRFTAVFTNHHNLILGKNPDWSVGARIWLDRPPQHTADKPTQYADVYFYEYYNDFPTSASNHP